MTQLGFYPTYLLDACCVTRLDRMDRRNLNPPTFTPVERAVIWDGLERLADQGRLKLITPVKRDLEHWYPGGLARLEAYPGHRLQMQRTAPTNVALYQQIVTRYPDIAPKPGRSDSDPWLLVAARRFGYTIVTMELSLGARSPTANKKMRIPDICTRENLLCQDLHGLAKDEGWLP